MNERLKKVWKFSWIILLFVIIGSTMYVKGYWDGLGEETLSIPQSISFCESKDLVWCSHDSNYNEITCGEEGCFVRKNTLLIYDNPSLKLKETIEKE